MQSNYIILILLMGLATYSTRAGFLVFSKKIKMSNLMRCSLKYIPISILTTLIFPGIFMPDNQLDISLTNHYIWAGLITASTVLISKNSILSILLGIISLITLRIYI